MGQIQQVITIGAEKLIVSADSLADLVETVQDMRLMSYRVRYWNGTRQIEDAVFRMRKNDGGEFLEMYSPSLKASKMVSKKLDKPDELYIGADTPWIRYDKETETTEVRFDVLTDQIAALGWTEEDMGRFVKAERCKSNGKKGVKRAWTYEPVRS